MSVLGKHKGDGIRYAMHLSAPKGGSAQMLRDPSGNWVSWDDYARLKAEVERVEPELEQRCRELNLSLAHQAVQLRQIGELKAEVERLTNENGNNSVMKEEWYIKCMSARAEVERLRKAGDWMCGLLRFDFVTKEWNAAKEGKPQS